MYHTQIESVLPSYKLFTQMCWKFFTVADPDPQPGRNFQQNSKKKKKKKKLIRHPSVRGAGSAPVFPNKYKFRKDNIN